MQLRVKRTHPAAQLPTRGSTDAAGYDLYAALDAPLTLEPGATLLVPAGIAVEIPSGHVRIVKDRSSLALAGLRTSGGVIDADYRGEVRVLLSNTNDFPYVITPGTRIAQMIILAVAHPELVEVAALSETNRGSGGFGSTGR
jgi:dUTP pyrophosphatase